MKNLLRNLAYASVIVAGTAVTVHQFNRPAGAQSGSSIVGYHAIDNNPGCVAGTFILSNGDVYYLAVPVSGNCGHQPAPAFVGNV